MEYVFIKFLNLSIQAGWLVIALLLLRPFLKKAPKYISCLLWAAVGLRLCLPFSIESVLSLIPSKETVPPEILYAAAPQVNTGVPLLNSAVNPILQSSMAPAPMASVNPMQLVMILGANLWILGMVVMALYAAVSYILLRWRLREAVRQSENIWLCDRVNSPFLLGLFRPRIYLPSNLAQETAAYVIAHEKAHLQRKDHWWKPLGFLILTVYWFNPLIWVAYILLCRDIEYACDEKVLRAMGTEHKKPYSEALVCCSVPRKMITACPVAFGEDGVKGRIQSILGYKKPAFWIILIAVVASIAVTVCFLTDPAHEPPDDRPVYQFKATVLSSRDGTLLVEPFADENEAKSADRFYVTIPEGAETFTAGEFVEIVYDGMIQELYPARIPNVTAITKLQSEDAFSNAPISYQNNAAFDIDEDGITENCYLTLGEPNCLLIYENGILEYHYPLLDDSSFHTLQDGKTVMIVFAQNGLHRQCDISIEDGELTLTGSSGLICSKSSPNVNVTTLSSLREKYPQFFGLTTDNGLEVYVWKNGEYRCGVRAGTDREATREELWAFRDGAALEEMAMLLRFYGATRENVTVLYSYHPAFSGPYPDVPKDQRAIEETLFSDPARQEPFAILPEQSVMENQGFDINTQYKLIIYAYQLGKNAWRFQFVKNSRLGHTALSLMEIDSVSLETARELLKSYDLAPEDIPVIVYCNPVSSYLGELGQAATDTARKLLFLSE